jgi:hypothetical protein
MTISSTRPTVLWRQRARLASSFFVMRTQEIFIPERPVETADDADDADDPRSEPEFLPTH